MIVLLTQLNLVIGFYVGALFLGFGLQYHTETYSSPDWIRYLEAVDYLYIRPYREMLILDPYLGSQDGVFVCYTTYAFTAVLLFFVILLIRFIIRSIEYRVIIFEKLPMLIFQQSRIFHGFKSRERYCMMTDRLGVMKKAKNESPEVIKTRELDDVIIKQNSIERFFEVGTIVFINRQGQSIMTWHHVREASRIKDYLEFISICEDNIIEVMNWHANHLVHQYLWKS